MMTDLLSDLATGSSKLLGNRETLLDNLDILSATYLDRLEEYQTARKQLSEALATGFFSLAQANFINSSRARFGQDHYDQRMQAIRTVHIQPADDPYVFEVTARKSPTAQADTNNPGKPIKQTEEKPSGDPIRWFGILVPSALRESQSSFSQAVDGPIPRLATISREMRRLESQMSRLRKEMKRTG